MTNNKLEIPSISSRGEWLSNQPLPIKDELAQVLIQKRCEEETKFQYQKHKMKAPFKESYIYPDGEFKFQYSSTVQELYNKLLSEIEMDFQKRPIFELLSYEIKPTLDLSEIDKCTTQNLEIYFKDFYFNPKNKDLGFHMLEYIAGIPCNEYSNELFQKGYYEHEGSFLEELRFDGYTPVYHNDYPYKETENLNIFVSEEEAQTSECYVRPFEPPVCFIKSYDPTEELKLLNSIARKDTFFRVDVKFKWEDEEDSLWFVFEKGIVDSVDYEDAFNTSITLWDACNTTQRTIAQYFLKDLVLNGKDKN